MEIAVAGFGLVAFFVTGSVSEEVRPGDSSLSEEEQGKEHGEEQASLHSFRPSVNKYYTGKSAFH